MTPPAHKHKAEIKTRKKTHNKRRKIPKQASALCSEVTERTHTKTRDALASQIYCCFNEATYGRPRASSTLAEPKPRWSDTFGSESKKAHRVPDLRRFEEDASKALWERVAQQTASPWHSFSTHEVRRKHDVGHTSSGCVVLVVPEASARATSECVTAPTPANTTFTPTSSLPCDADPINGALVREKDTYPHVGCTQPSDEENTGEAE